MDTPPRILRSKVFNRMARYLYGCCMFVDPPHWKGTMYPSSQPDAQQRALDDANAHTQANPGHRTEVRAYDEGIDPPPDEN